ncbi:MAG: flagellar motor switch protein FliN [Planctomycetota bacterium]
MADESEQVDQDEIEALLRQAESGNMPASDAPTEAKPEAAADNTQVDQAEIEALLSGGAAPSAPTPAPQPTAAPVVNAASSGSPPVTDAAVSQNDIELLLDKAEQALGSIDQTTTATALPPGVRTFEFAKFGGTPANPDSATLELMRDVQLDMTIELGRTHMQLEELLKLKQGAVVPLDKLAGDPADIYVNGRLVARGEVLVLNDNFCIRVAELIEGEHAVA